MKEFEILVGRLDYSHRFVEPDWPALLCVACGKIRALHADTGFIPGHIPSLYGDDPAVRFRGAHPRWTKPQSVRIDKLEESEMFVSPQRRAVAQRIRTEEARQLSIALS
jgi:hypothetical protein